MQAQQQQQQQRKKQQQILAANEAEGRTATKRVTSDNGCHHWTKENCSDCGTRYGGMVHAVVQLIALGGQLQFEFNLHHRTLNGTSESAAGMRVIQASLDLIPVLRSVAGTTHLPLQAVSHHLVRKV